LAGTGASATDAALDTERHFGEDHRDDVVARVRAPLAGRKELSVMTIGDAATRPYGEPRPARPLRVVVADDSALLREGIASLLGDAGHDVVGRAADARELLLKVRSQTPDIAIVDVRMPPRLADDGLVAAAEIRRTHPSVAVLVLSQHLEPAYMLELVGDDASGVGYLLKDRVRDVAEFLDAVERVAAGGTAFDSEVVRVLVRGHRRSVVDDLTERERSVLGLIAEGRSNRAIGRQLHLSPRAVERHVHGIFEKLHLPESEDDNRRVLAVIALLGRPDP
jgi:DNA-binding NarL/FixJ family response regulator